MHIYGYLGSTGGMNANGHWGTLGGFENPSQLDCDSGTSLKFLQLINFMICKLDLNKNNDLDEYSKYVCFPSPY